MPPSLQAAEVYRDVFDTRVTNYVAFIGYTILVWDHLITFGDEVRYIWRGRKSLVIYLFFFVRYYTPFAFIGNLIAYFSDWSFEYCNKFVRYEGANTALGVCVCSTMMLMRVKALYADRPNVVRGLGLLLLGQVGVFAWLLTRGQAVEHTPAVKGIPMRVLVMYVANTLFTFLACTMIFDPDLHFYPSLSAWLPLVFDTIVILLTLYRCALPVRQHTASYILLTLLKDGLLYYSIIFGVNLVLAIMIITARDGIKNIAAQLELLLTVAMMSRITLSLRRKALMDPSSDDEEDSYLYPQSTEAHSFHVYDHHGRLRQHSDWDKSSQHWIEHGARNKRRPDIYDSRASLPTPWGSYHQGHALSSASVDSDVRGRSFSQQIVSGPTGERKDSALRDDDPSRNIEFPDSGAQPDDEILSKPIRAVVRTHESDFELEAIRASPILRR